MPHPVLDVDHLRVDPEAYLRERAEIFAAFRQQDSGCHALGIALGDERWFVKFSVEARAVPSLERAVAFHRDVVHPAVIPLRSAIRTPSGLALVYPWVDGEVLYGAPVTGPVKRLDPEGPHARFRSLSVTEILDALEAIFDAHLAVAAQGLVAVDLYDGCFIYDFQTRTVRLCDLDEYRPGPFVVQEQRLPGSRRFMAPEEFRRGAVIDQRTTVFNLGRTAQVLLDEGDLDGRFRGGPRLAEVAGRATRDDPADRFACVADFLEAWRAARHTEPSRKESIDGGLVVAAYDPAWPGLFASLGRRLRAALGAAALRIDHIGSTAVPGLDAKPIIDVQISVAAFEPLTAFRVPLESCGFWFRPKPEELSRRYFRERPGDRRTHVHVRRAGSFAEQLNLLHRDYLRADPARASEYAQLKYSLAYLLHTDRQAYVDAKAPFVWETLRRAEQWSDRAGWEPGPSDA